MIIECPECGAENQTDKPPQPGKRYHCGKCGAVITFLQTDDTQGETVNFPITGETDEIAEERISSQSRSKQRDNMSNDELPISLATFLILGILPRLMERDWRGNQYIRLGRVLTLSSWLYETGAILGRFWKDRLRVVVEMFEIEGKREEFTQYWCNQAKKRLEKYRGQPNSFPIFIVQTDLEMYTGKKLDDLLKIGDKKLHHKEGQEWLRVAETSLIEGIMFGSMFPDLTHTILVNEYEKIDINSWKEARKYGVTLSEEPPKITTVDKEKEAIEMARDYVAKYHPELIDDLRLAEI